MWAPADLFTRTVDAISLALKRAATFTSDNIVMVSIACGLVIVAVVLFSQVRGRDRRN